MDEIINESIRSSEINPNDEDDLKCGPTTTLKDGSCIILDVLIDMVKSYNEDNPTKEIRLHDKLETLNPKKYKRYLVKELGYKLSSVCNTQRCWMKQKFITKMKKELKDKLKHSSFRPSGPQGQFTWLNTFNINQVIEQYEEKYRDFKFMGAVPIDFDDLPQLGIKDMNLGKMSGGGKSKLGFVFNLDEHYKGGSHWVSMFTDLNKGQLYFSDSYGIKPEKRIRKLFPNTTYVKIKKVVK